MFEKFGMFGLSHQMELVKIYPSKAEEWHCPLCNRRFLLYWPPNYAKEVLVEGNTAVNHYGGKTGSNSANAKIIGDDDVKHAA